VERGRKGPKKALFYVYLHCIFLPNLLNNLLTKFLIGLEMSDKVILMNNESGAVETSGSSGSRLATTTGAARNNSLASPASRNVHNHYEELMDGVPCPSCRGTGRIPKELERQLVALIPIDDKRLRPRRTWFWVSVAVFICLIICGLLLFFLIPRSISLTSENPSVTEVNVIQYEKGKQMVLSFLNVINVSNDNFFGIRVVNATSNVIRVLFPDKNQVIGRGVMLGGSMNVPMQASAVALTLNHSVQLTDWSLAMCELPYGYVRLYFQFTVTFEYFNHREQDTLENSQLVCCTASGNCTTPFSFLRDEPIVPYFSISRT